MKAELTLATFVIIAVSLLVLIGKGCQKYERSRIQSHPKITLIDGCEYLEFSTYGGNLVWTHKGNCKNPEHR
jgi:hypothetical protein